MRIQDLIIGIIIFAVFMITILGFAYEINSSLEVTMDNETASALSEFNTNAESTKTNMFGVVIEMQNTSIGGSDVQADSSKTYGDNVIGSGVRAVTIASRSFSIIENTLNVLGKWLHVDPIFIAAFFAIVTIVIIMIFASSVLYNRL